MKTLGIDNENDNIHCDIHTPAPNKAQHSPLPWTLHRLDDQWNGEKRWSAGVNGPRVYLTCEEENAQLIVRAVNHADKLAEALRDCETTPGALAERSHEYALRRLATITETARQALAAYEAAQ